MDNPHASSGFMGFPKGFAEFFIGIRLNNCASWFNEHRTQFESDIKRPMFALIEALTPTLLEIDQQFDCRPARSLARIHRDTRFSNNKEPYRDHIWFSVKHTGEGTADGISFYFEISALTARWGCGFYFVERAVMDVLRRMCLETPHRVLDTIDSPAFKERFLIEGEKYKRMAVPEGVQEPLRSLWIHKDLYVAHGIERMDLLYGPELAEVLDRDFRILAPFYHMLRECQDAGRGVESERLMQVQG
ncbi:TIGR02453 family protein [Clostridia bacterium]|nr:TIGR02453 family protein [Clostridia bacterium]